MLSALKMEEGNMNQGMWVDSRCREKQGNGFSPEPPKGTQICQHLDFSPVRPTLDFLPYISDITVR